jgi:hypothetical protein
MMVRKSVFVALWSMIGLSSVIAGSPATPQATPLPQNIPVIGNVQVSGSDARAAAFNQQWMPKFQAIIDKNLAEQVVFVNASGFKLDSDRFFLRQAANQTIRVYFLAEGAGYQNALGFTFSPAGSTTPGTPRLLFPNASIQGGTVRNIDNPLKPGDFVEIGTGGNGWQLDFFLLPNGFQSWRSFNGQGTPPYIPWLWNDINKNCDNFQHVVAFVMPDSPFILVGFEDLIGGGDRDYNDALFVVDVGIENATNLIDESTLPQ